MARKISMRQALNEALDQEMARDKNVIVMGEDIVGGMGGDGEKDAWGGVLGVTKGLYAKYGERLLDTPLSESAYIGAAVGAAAGEPEVERAEQVRWAHRRTPTFKLPDVDHLVVMRHRQARFGLPQHGMSQRERQRVGAQAVDIRVLNDCSIGMAEHGEGMRPGDADSIVNRQILGDEIMC